MPAKTVQGEHFHSPIATNLRALAAQQFGGSINALAEKIDINQSTLNRYCNGSSDITMQKISEIADATGYAPWQLLHPDFDTRRMPPMMDARTMRVAAIFANIPDPKDRDRAEAIMEQFSPD
jgi:transcriptional regulator with XRE-family HTH domain